MNTTWRGVALRVITQKGDSMRVCECGHEVSDKATSCPRCQKLLAVKQSTLIKCGDCGNEISKKAVSCPQCGNPINPVKTSNNVQTIQKTSKDIKAAGCLGCLIFLAGWPTLYVSPAFGTLMIIFGILVGINAEISKWWHHS